MRSQARRSLKAGARALPPVIVAATIAGAWSLASLLGVESVPPPWDVLSEFIDGFDNGLLPRRMGESLMLFLYAYPAAVVVGFLLGVAIGTSQYWRRATHLLLLGAYSVPKVIFFPVFLMIFGIGDISKVALIFWAATLPVLVSAISAVDAIPVVIKKYAAVSSSSFWTRTTKIYLPAMMPELLVGARLALSISWMYVAISEMLMGFKGLGYELNLYYAHNNVAGMLMIAAVLFVLGLIGSFLIMFAGRRWRIDNRQSGTPRPAVMVG